jgi:ADP-heptose:LPS heptosyltransferase
VVTAAGRPALGRRISDAARELAQRAAAAACAGDATARPPDWDARPWRVLAVRTGSMGDTVLFTSLLRAIAASHRTLTVDALVRTPYVGVLQHLPFVGAVLPFDCTERHRNPDPGLLARLWRRRYDVIVDGLVSGPGGRGGFPTATTMLALGTRARYRVGQGGLRNSYLMNLPVMIDPARHQLERAAALAGPFGVPIGGTDWRPTLALTDRERAEAEARWRHGATTGSGGRRFRLLVNVSAGLRAKEWKDERHIEVIRRARADSPGIDVLVTGVPAQEGRIARIAGDSGARWSVQSMRDALALCATADTLLTPDTGMTHVASAFGRPTVVLLPPANWMWTPYRVPFRTVVAADDASLDSISADAVTAALRDLMAELRRTPAGANRPAV